MQQLQSIYFYFIYVFSFSFKFNSILLTTQSIPIYQLIFTNTYGIHTHWTFNELLQINTWPLLKVSKKWQIEDKNKNIRYRF